MNLRSIIEENRLFGNLELTANQIVEGFISGIHKSPFHGFSSEFAEHKNYNPGESTKHIDWKLYAKTDKLYTKKYDDETNLRCHFIIDNSSSMHYPVLKKQNLDQYNKYGFSAIATASLIQLLKKQRDAAGLSLINNQEYIYHEEKGSKKHFSQIINTLDLQTTTENSKKRANLKKTINLLCERLKKRSMVILFSDFLNPIEENDEIFEALQQMKFKKHEIVIFQVFDFDKELNFNFDNKPSKFIDIETNQEIDLYPENGSANYQKQIQNLIANTKDRCNQLKINYNLIDINKKFHTIINEFLISKQKF